MRTVERNLPLLIDGFGEHVVRVPARQSGVMSVVGYFSAQGRAYVIKLLRVADLRLLCPHVAQPAYARLLSRATRAESWYAPGPIIKGRVRSQHAECVPLLRNVGWTRAYAALRGVLRARPSEVGSFVDHLYGDRDVFDFAPAVSVITEATSPDLRSSDGYLALVQDDVGTGEAAHAVRLTTRVGAEPAANDLLLLLALAHDIARRHKIGLDLVPRMRAAHGLAIAFPNVLVGSAGRLQYVDFFAMGTPDGSLLERFGHNLLYGRWSSVAAFTRWLFARQMALIDKDRIR